MVYGKQKHHGKYGEIKMDKKNFWENKNVFITGADGFIASWISKRLIKYGSSVFVVIRSPEKKNGLDLQNIRNDVKIIKGDILNFELMKKILKDNEIDTCFHLAAQAIVGDAAKSPMSAFETNIRGTWHILEAARIIPTVERIVVASSDKAYGDQKDLPYTEDYPLLGIYPYDASKVCADVISRSYAKTYGLPVGVTRLANIYGGGDLHMNRIVPGTICSVLKGETPIIRSDGTLERDYMYIEDAVNAYLTLAENLNKKEVRGEAFNFGTGKPTSVLELFNKIIKLCGSNVKPKILNEVKVEIRKQYLSSEKAKRLLNWNVIFSLDDGLKLTIKWYKENRTLWE